MLFGVGLGCLVQMIKTQSDVQASHRISSCVTLRRFWRRRYSSFLLRSLKQRACWRGSSQELWGCLWCCPSSPSHWAASTWIGATGSFSSSSTPPSFLSHCSQSLGRSTSEVGDMQRTILAWFNNTLEHSSLQTTTAALFIWTVTERVKITNKDRCSQGEIKLRRCALFNETHLCRLELLWHFKGNQTF